MVSANVDHVDRRVPDFLIIGAMKAGTTAIAEMMGSHPEIYIPQSKEPTYFINHDEEFIFGDGKKAKYAYGPTRLHEYLSLFEGVPTGVLKGEASTQYLANPSSPKLVYDSNPNTKLIVVLRDPVARAYSAYSYNRTIQREMASTFSRALSEELNGSRDNYYFAFRYLHYGLYAQHLARWKQFFPVQQIKIVLFDNFKNNPIDFFADIAEYLNVGGFTSIEKRSFDNKTVIPKSSLQRGLWWIIEAPHPLKLFAKRYLAHNLLASLKKQLKSRLITIGASSPEMTQEDRDLIGCYFSQDLIQLKNEFGLEIDD